MSVQWESQETERPFLSALIPTPLGQVLAVACNEGLLRLGFIDDAAAHYGTRGLHELGVSNIIECGDAADGQVHLSQLAEELAEYFAGTRTEFSLPLAPQGTEFEMRAWDYLQTIPYGQTRSYSQQARAIGEPNACRAVGRANGMNRIAIVIPCHRVIGSDGKLTGYAGGVERKRWLVEHERNVIGVTLFCWNDRA